MTFATAAAVLSLPLLATAIVLLFLTTVSFGYHRWLATKRKARCFICPTDFLRRYQLGTGLPWLVRWTGRFFAVENPRQHERFADYFVCHGCGGTQKLEGIQDVVGVIGDKPADWQQDGDTVKVCLWFDAEQRIRNADIDRLEIRPGGVKDYERAVNAVINVLKNDVSRPAKYLKRVPVIVQGKPPLSLAAERMLRDTFKIITYA